MPDDPSPEAGFHKAMPAIGGLLNSISHWCHRASFNHEDHCSLRRSRSMQDALRDCKSLLRGEFNGLVFQVDAEPPIHNKKELILVVVLVPVEFTSYNSEPHDAVVDPTQRLVKPVLLTFLLQLLDINELKRAESHVGVDGIPDLGGHIRSPFAGGVRGSPHGQPQDGVQEAIHRRISQVVSAPTSHITFSLFRLKPCFMTANEEPSLSIAVFVHPWPPF